MEVDRSWGQACVLKLFSEMSSENKIILFYAMTLLKTNFKIDIAVSHRVLMLLIHS